MSNKGSQPSLCETAGGVAMKCIQQVAILVVLLALLAACSSISAPASEPVTVTFVVVTLPWLSGQSAEYERLAVAFHEANPHIHYTFAYFVSANTPHPEAALRWVDFLTRQHLN
jgi:hypothetical protein